VSIFHDITDRRWMPSFDYVPLYTATATDWRNAYRFEAAQARRWRAITRAMLTLREFDRAKVAHQQRINAVIAARQAIRIWRRLARQEALALEIASSDDDSIRLRGFQAARARQWPGDNPFRFAGFERARSLWLEGFRLWWESRPDDATHLPALH